MPDMMCKNGQCPSCSVCYRFTARPSQNQRYHEYRIRGRYSIACDQFWPAREAKPGDYKTEPLGKKPMGNHTGNTGGLTHVVREARERGRYNK